MDFRNKIIWVSGASSGIGEALVYEFLKEEATVICSSSNGSRLKHVQEKSGSDRCIPFVLDLLDLKAMPRVVEEVFLQFGRVDILVHVAGVSQRSKVLEIDMNVFRTIMDINFYGTVELTRLVLPRMLEQGGGQLAVVSSIVGLFGFPLRSAYSASKHALHGYFESLQTECLDKNIHVSILIPGRVKTNISKNALTADGTPWSRMDEGQKKGIPVNKAARKIVHALKKKRRRKMIGGTELIMVYIKKFFPGIYWWLVRKIRST